MNVMGLKGLTVDYGHVRAVDNVDLDVPEHTLVGLIGPNGAGKTTLVDAVSGLTAARGRIEFNGEDLTPLPAHRRARKGIARTFQSIELFDDLSVRENLLTAAEPSSAISLLKAFAGARVDAPTEQRIAEILSLLGIADLAEILPSELSLGQRKLVTIGRALAGRPSLLLLDEPAAGLDTDESLVLGERLRTVIDTGVSILLVDHDMELVHTVCDYIYVLDFGKILASGTPPEIANDSRVIHAYLGEPVDPPVKPLEAAL